MNRVSPTLVPVDATPTRLVHALYSSWTSECGADGWTVPFWVGGVNCDACLSALPKKAAGIAIAGAR